jgi:hypothetical protein
VRSEALAETVGRDGKVKATTPHNDNARQVEVAERSDAKGAWIVEAIGHDGELYQAIFAGPNAADRAKEYAAFKYGLSPRNGRIQFSGMADDWRRLIGGFR